MEWWEWGTWGLALVTGAGGLILGVRAEIRNNRYVPHWTPESNGGTMTFHNRTGEDASNVRLDVADGWSLANYRPYSVVHVDQSASFAIVAGHPSSAAPFGCLLRWVRSSTGREYRLAVGDTELAIKLSKDNPPPRGKSVRTIRFQR